MKKRILTLLAAACIAVAAFGATACVPKQFQSGDHPWAEEWTHDIDYHWHYCTDANCFGKNEYARHSYDYRNPERLITPATCGTSGRGIFKCDDCGVYINDIIPATGEHNYVWAYDEETANCLVDGRGVYFCSVCSDVATIVEPATGDHEYSEGNWTKSKAGHEQLCEVCGVSSGLIPHVEVRSEAMSKNPTGTTPPYENGYDAYVCEVCGYLIRTEEVVNPYAPKTLTITFDDATSYNQVNDEYCEVTVKAGRTYINYAARNSLGNSVAVDYAVMGTDSGVRGYLVDDKTGSENLLDTQNMDPVYYGLMNNGRSFVEIKSKGVYTIVFKYETRGEMRTQVTIVITVV